MKIAEPKRETKSPPPEPKAASKEVETYNLCDNDPEVEVCIEVPTRFSRRWNKLRMKTPNSPSSMIITCGESVISELPEDDVSESVEVPSLNVDALTVDQENVGCAPCACGNAIGVTTFVAPTAHPRLMHSAGRRPRRSKRRKS